MRIEGVNGGGWDFFRGKRRRDLENKRVFVGVGKIEIGVYGVVRRLVEYSNKEDDGDGGG